MTRLLATVPMRIGAANGSTHVPNINNLNSHPDKVNQRKNIICKEKKIKHINIVRKKSPKYIDKMTIVTN